MKARQPRCEQLYQVGEELIASKHHASAEIKSHISSLKDKWQRLLDLVAKRRARLDDAQESHQVCVPSIIVFTHSSVPLQSNNDVI